jgi:hypothetical protein
MPVQRLIVELVEVVARDNLTAAVLDDMSERS